MNGKIINKKYNLKIKIFKLKLKIEFSISCYKNKTTYNHSLIFLNPIFCTVVSIYVNTVSVTEMVIKYSFS